MSGQPIRSKELELDNLLQKRFAEGEKFVEILSTEQVQRMLTRSDFDSQFESNFLIELRALKKLKSLYGNLSKKYVQRIIKKQFRVPHNITRAIFHHLESRLDVVLYRSGLFRSVRSARQKIRNRLVLVNGKSVALPGYLLTAADIVQIDQRKLTKVEKKLLYLKSEQNNDLLPGISKGDVTLRMPKLDLRKQAFPSKVSLFSKNLNNLLRLPSLLGFKDNISSAYVKPKLYKDNTFPSNGYISKAYVTRSEEWESNILLKQKNLCVDFFLSKVKGFDFKRAHGTNSTRLEGASSFDKFAQNLSKSSNLLPFVSTFNAKKQTFTEGYSFGHPSPKVLEYLRYPSPKVLGVSFDLPNANTLTPSVDTNAEHSVISKLFNNEAREVKTNSSIVIKEQNQPRLENGETRVTFDQALLHEIDFVHFLLYLKRQLCNDSAMAREITSVRLTRNSYLKKESRVKATKASHLQVNYQSLSIVYLFAPQRISLDRFIEFESILSKLL